MTAVAPERGVGFVDKIIMVSRGAAAKSTMNHLIVDFCDSPVYPFKRASAEAFHGPDGMFHITYGDTGLTPLADFFR